MRVIENELSSYWDFWNLTRGINVLLSHAGNYPKLLFSDGGDFLRTGLRNIEVPPVLRHVYGDSLEARTISLNREKFSVQEYIDLEVKSLDSRFTPTAHQDSTYKDCFFTLQLNVNPKTKENFVMFRSVPKEWATIFDYEALNSVCDSLGLTTRVMFNTINALKNKDVRIQELPNEAVLGSYISSSISGKFHLTVDYKSLKCLYHSFDLFA